MSYNTDIDQRGAHSLMRKFGDGTAIKNDKEGAKMYIPVGKQTHSYKQTPHVKN